MRLIEKLGEENLIIQIIPEINELFLNQIRIEFIDLHNNKKIKRIFLSFSSVTQLTSTGLSILFNMKLFFKAFYIEVVIVNLSKEISNLIKAVGLDQMLKEETIDSNQSDKDFKINDRSQNEVQALKSELEYQKELYNRVTKDLENKLSKSYFDLKFKNEQLQLVNKSHSIGELAAGVAHEFNNIIGGIMGYAQLAQAKKTPEIIDKALSNIISLSKRSESITTGLLNFSRKSPEKVSVVNFKDVILNVLEFTQKQLENNKIIVHTDFQETEKFFADENLLSQVILNLVINASHAMENGGELFISLFKENDFIVLTIRDTGCGIKGIHLNKIFLPFFTTKGVLGGGNKVGTGLGLSISRSIIEMHEGTLDVESKVDVGSTFTIKLPMKLCTSDFKTEVDLHSDTHDENIKINKSKILVVDDEEIMRSLISVALTDVGHEIFEGINGEEGLKLYRMHNPHLIILDILMPIMNGMDAYLEIRKVNAQAKIVFITGQAGKNLEKILGNVTKNENVFLLRKPFDIKELINVVNIALSSN